MRGVQYAIYSTRPLLEYCKSCTARPSTRINWLIVTLSDLDRHVQCLTRLSYLSVNLPEASFLKLTFVTNDQISRYFENYH